MAEWRLFCNAFTASGRCYSCSSHSTSSLAAVTCFRSRLSFASHFRHAALLKLLCKPSLPFIAAHAVVPFACGFVTSSPAPSSAFTAAMSSTVLSRVAGDTVLFSSTSTCRLRRALWGQRLPSAQVRPAPPLGLLQNLLRAAVASVAEQRLIVLFRYVTVLLPSVRRSLHSTAAADQAGGADGGDSSRFCLFLCHLYFARQYRYPPFLAVTDVDLTATAPPLSLHFPPVRSLDWSDKSRRLRSTDDGKLFARNEALLTLAHYIDCAQMMQQCEAVCLTQVADGERGNNYLWLTSQCLESLQYADRYNMRVWKAACLRIIAADKGVSKTAEYRKAELTWGAQLLEEVQAAADEGQTGAEEHKNVQQLPPSPILPTIRQFDSIGDAVFFPPRQHADFVIQYVDTDFYVHRFVLYYHSAFFRTHVDRFVTSDT